MGYEVIKDATYIEARSIPEPNSGCWIWLHTTSKNGYGRIGDHGINKGAHRVSYEVFKGPVRPDQMVLHKCDIRCCVNPDHLFLGDQQDNLRDMHKKGRGRAKLTPAQVLDIQSRPKYRGLIVDLVKEFGMQYEHLWGIRNGRSWNFIRTQTEGDQQEKEG